MPYQKTGPVIVVPFLDRAGEAVMGVQRTPSVVFMSAEAKMFLCFKEPWKQMKEHDERTRRLAEGCRADLCCHRY